jgi:hypothetical protein
MTFAPLIDRERSSPPSVDGWRVGGTEAGKLFPREQLEITRAVFTYISY